MALVWSLGGCQIGGLYAGIQKIIGKVEVWESMIPELACLTSHNTTHGNPIVSLRYWKKTLWYFYLRLYWDIWDVRIICLDKLIVNSSFIHPSLSPNPFWTPTELPSTSLVLSFKLFLAKRHQVRCCEFLPKHAYLIEFETCLEL